MVETNGEDIVIIVSIVAWLIFFEYTFFLKPNLAWLDDIVNRFLDMLLPDTAQDTAQDTTQTV